MSAQDRALAAGSSKTAVEKALSKDFLFQCLRRASIDEELLDDIAEACEMNDFTSLSLAGGDLSVSDAADKLFLMEDEASVLIRTCRNECAKIGVDFGDGFVPDESSPVVEEPPKSVTHATKAPDPGPSALGTVPAPKAPEPEPVSTVTAPEHEPEQDRVEDPLLNATIEEPSTAPAVGIAGQEHDTKENDALERSVPVTPAVTPAKIPKKSNIPTPTRSQTSATASKPASSETPSSIPRPASARTQPQDNKTPRNVTPSAPKPKSVVKQDSTTKRPGSALSAASTPTPVKSTPRPKSAIPTPVNSASSKLAKVKAHTLNDVGSSDESTESAAKAEKPLPSYARPTAAALARAKKEGNEESPTSRPNSGRSTTSLRGSQTLSGSVTGGDKINVSSAGGGNVFSAISSRLLRPTAAFLSWASGKGKDAGGKDKIADGSLRDSFSAKGGGSRELKDPKGGAGRPITKPQPFNLSGGRKTAVSLTTEELQLQKAKEEAGKFRARPAPKAPVSAEAKSSVKLEAVDVDKKEKPLTSPEPFKLASAERHSKAQEELARKVEEERKKEADMRSSFKARSFKDALKNATPDTKSPTEKHATVPQAPKLSSDERMKYHQDVLTPQRKAREEAAKQAKEEEERKKKDAQDQLLKDERKKHEFHASPVPDFSKTFSPDHSLAKPPTEPKEFHLETDKRVGKQGRTEEDIVASDLNVASPNGATNTSGEASSTVAPAVAAH